jgi:hypothetical protein
MSFGCSWPYLYVKIYFPNTYITFGCTTAFIFGVLTIGLSFAAEYMGDKLLEMTLSVWSIFGGPLAGVFIMGFFFPWVNTAVRFPPAYIWLKFEPVKLKGSSKRFADQSGIVSVALHWRPHVQATYAYPSLANGQHDDCNANSRSFLPSWVRTSTTYLTLAWASGFD